MTDRLIAYHGDADFKARFVASMEHHRAADRIVKGIYWDNGKGCSVGCAAESLGIAAHNDHAAVGAATGYGHILQRLNDTIFEGLPNKLAMEWPVRFARAAQPGADLTLVPWQFLHWLATDTLDRHGSAAVRAGCAEAVAVLADMAAGVAVTRERVDTARAAAAATAAAAEAAARAAAVVVVVARAAWAARAAAEAAAEEAVVVARAAEAAAAYARMSDRLIALIEAAPVTQVAHD